MKKSLFIIAAAALVVGCANNDVKNDIAPTPIGFTKVYIEKGTKAFQTGAYTSANFETEGNTFAVYGFKTTSTQTNARVFDEKVVTFSTDWTYSPLVYWDKTASSYSFYAYAPDDSKFTGTAAFTTDNDPHSFSISGFKQATSQASMIDLMTDMSSKGSVTGNAIGTNDVEFTFTHILSNINVLMAVSGDLKADATNNPVIVNSVSIGAIKMDGEYGYNSGYKWSLTNPQVTAATTFTATQAKESNTAVFGSNELKAVSQNTGSTLSNDVIGTNPVPGLTDLLFVPQAVDASYAITVQYKIANEVFDKTILLSEFKKTVDNVDTPLSTWAPGNQYNYVLVIGPTPILFDVASITGWSDGGTYTYTIQ